LPKYLDSFKAVFIVIVRFPFNISTALVIGIFVSFANLDALTPK
jgi:hypothetical protein